MAIYRKVLNPKQRTPQTAWGLGRLVRILVKAGKLADAEGLLREELAALQQAGSGGYDLIAVRYRLSAVLRDQGKLAEAEAWSREAVAAQTKFLASQAEPDRYRTLLALQEFRAQLKLVDVEPLYREALHLNRQFGTNQPDYRPWLAWNLADTLRKQGKPDEAEPLLREAITNAARLWPNDPEEWQDYLFAWINLRFTLGQQAAAERELGAMLVPEQLGASRDFALLEVRAYLSGRTGKWKDAATDYARLIELAPTNQMLFHCYAPLLVMGEEIEVYRRLCRHMLVRSASPKEPWTAEWMAMDCLLLPPAAVDLPAVGKLAELAVKATDDRNLPWFQATKSLAEYREGHFAEAVLWAQRALAAADKDPELDGRAYPVLAMAHHQLNHAEEARATLAKAVELTEKKLPQLDSGDLGGAWDDVLRDHILLREAKALLQR